MNLLSLSFWLVIFLSLLIYYLIPTKYRWGVLLILSYYFYIQSGVKYLSYIMTTTLTVFYSSKKIQKINMKKSRLSRRENKDKYEGLQLLAKKYLMSAIFINVFILLFLKYYNFPAQIIRMFSSSNHFANQWFNFKILMPLGISFYTFQSIGYLIDVYRGKVTATDHLGKFSLFVSYFPQLIQGPISRFSELYSQFEEPREFDYNRLSKAALLIGFGFFKKLVIADRAAILVNQVYDNHLEYKGIILFIGALFYAIQIYGDFSGGIDIIRGISSLYGIELVDNFKRPYFSRSVSEFWQRWHITLGDWMRDYVFYPIALSKPIGLIGRKARKQFGNHLGKQLPAAIASTIVFVLVGAWHGSSMKFIVYGLYNGMFVLSEPLLKPIYSKVRLKVGIENEKSESFIAFQVIRTLIITTIGRVFSRQTSLLSSLVMIKNMFSTWNPWVLFDGTIYSFGLDRAEINVLFLALILLFVISFIQEKGVELSSWLFDQPLVFRWLIIYCFIVIIVIFGVYGPSTSASDFIYGGF